MNGDGSIAWQKTYGGAGDENLNIKQASDGGYLAAGYTKSYGAGGSDGWLLKLDNQGQIVWQKTYGGNEDDRFEDVIETADHHYLVVGETKSFGPGDNDLWVLKLNSDGSPQGIDSATVPLTSSAAPASSAITVTATAITVNTGTLIEKDSTATIKPIWPAP